MIYRLVFEASAKKEWDNLDANIQLQFKKKLRKPIEHPRVESSRLNGMQDCYKIKLRSVVYGLVYQVRDKELIVAVIAIGKREKNAVYKTAVKRI